MLLEIDYDEPLTPFAERVLAVAAANVVDLAGENLYVIGHKLARNVAACYGPGQDRMWFEEIAAAGKWHGRGIAIVADLGKIYGGTFAYARGAGLDEAAADYHARSAIAGKLLHELCHGIEHGREGEAQILSDGVDVARDAFERVFVDDEQPEYITNAPEPIEPWHHRHGLPFIRAAALIHSRVTPDLPVWFGDIVQPESYGLSQGKYYYAACCVDADFDEPDTVPIRSIIARAAGPILRERWRADVFNWFKASPRTDAHMAAAEEALALCGPASARAATALASQDYLPAANEHFAEVRPTPEAWQHDSFEQVDVAPGVRGLDARLRDGPDDSLQPAAIYFDDSAFTVAEAETWMNRRHITFARIAASKNSMYPQLTA
jgi:hypothetical protein